MGITPKIMNDFRGEIVELLLVDPITAPAQSTAIEHPRDQIIQRLIGLLNELNLPSRAVRQQLEVTVVYEANAEVSLLGDFRKAKIDHLAFNFEKSGRTDDLRQVVTGSNGTFTMNFIRENLAIDVLHSEFRNLGEDGHKIAPNDPFHISQFARDPFVVLSGQTGVTVLLKPFYLWPSSSGMTNEQALVGRYIPDILSDQLGYATSTTSLLLEGGNVLAGDDFAIVGYRIVATNLDVHSGNPLLNSLPKILEKLAQCLGVSEVFCPDYDFEDAGISPRPVGLYHLDLFLTMLAAQNGVTTVALATLKLWDGKAWVDAPDNDSDQAYLDEYARVLQRGQGDFHRFAVKRIPLLRHDGHYYSYNNCLVETAPNGLVSVLLPSFEMGSQTANQPDFQIMDKKVEKMVRSWRMNPYMIRRNFRSLAARGAGLRCITQVLRRTTD